MLALIAAVTTCEKSWIWTFKPGVTDRRAIAMRITAAYGAATTLRKQPVNRVGSLAIVAAAALTRRR